VFGKPVELDADDRVAWELYKRITALSAVDKNGLPTLQNIKFVFDTYDYEVDSIEDLNEKIMYIHNTHLNYLKDRANKRG
jgi:transposase